MEKESSRTNNRYYVIASKFDCGQVKEVKEFGNGNINDTFLVKTEGANAPDYILQRINETVFPKIDELMSNQEAVIRHGEGKTIFQPLVKLVSGEGGYLFRDEEGQFFRMSVFADEHIGYDRCPNATVASQAGRTIGTMVVTLSDFNVENLHVTIPDFHNLKKRMEQLEQAKASGIKERIEGAEDLIKEIESIAPEFLRMYDAACSGALPLRASHNDTKFNNLLFHPHKDVGIVVDLDTLMPGYSFFDIGDVLRSGMVSAEEDEADLSKVELNKVAYNAFVDAFLEIAGSVLTEKEVEFIPSSGGFMSFMLAVRFLSDYMNGDKYFKTKYSNHNLIRARCQLKVCALFKELV